MDPQRRYFFPITGYNFRLTNVACAMLCGQLERQEYLIERRQWIYKQYQDRLAGIPGIYFQPVADWAKPAHWLFCITVNKQEYGSSRDELMDLLDKEDIETRPFFIPLHNLPPFREESRLRKEHLPVTDLLGASGINLPTFPGLTEKEIESVTTKIRVFLK
jgi:perosamine synthetase